VSEVRLSYRVVDVFTDRAFAGNPLAVVLDAEALSTAQLQSIAREFNLSETAFPLAPTTKDATYRLRIFTPASELPFAGHPSVGSAWVMRDVGRVTDGRVIQECGAGLLPVDIAGDTATLTGGAARLGPLVGLDAAAAAVGLESDDLVGDPVQWAGTGIDFGFIHVKPDAVARARVDMTHARGLPPGAGLAVFSYAAGAAHSRVFAPEQGVAEDPATGSAALGLGVWLAAHGYVAGDGATTYVVTQGIEIGRPSRLECAVRCEAGRVIEVQVSGSVVLIAEGMILVPPDSSST
jgi:trans-2,3-dihydro-3-hydroxyanthranilate isomerase